jgi:FtsH-binding integral membrane protein
MNSDLEAISFSVRRSCRYHARRKAFYENMHKIFNFIIIIVSSGSILGLCAEFLNSAFMQQVSAVVVTVLATLDLVIGFSVKAKEHEILYRRFCDLNIRMAASTESENDFVKDRLDSVVKL